MATRHDLKCAVKASRQRLSSLHLAEKDTAFNIAWYQTCLERIRRQIAAAEQDHVQARQRLADHVREGMEALKRRAAE